MKIVLVYADVKSPWVSAQSIRENLRKVWLGIDSLEVVDSAYSMEQDWMQWGQSLQSKKPDLIVFLESMPVPVKAVGAITKISSLKSTPFLFHLYGDFSINTHKWFSAGQLLIGRRVMWLTASAAQHGQFLQFCKPVVDVRCLPFPVDCEFFNPFSLKKEAADPEFKFFYTGRFSRQKNTLLLLEWAAEYLQKNSNVSFDFAGPFDDIGGGLWGLKEPRGWTASKWMTKQKSFPSPVRRRIRYHGVLSASEVRDLALKSDCYVSLSTFHDEDFGMAPLESLLCGTRAILSGWGGFSSFGFDKEGVEILPVGIENESLTLKKQDFFKALDKAQKKKKVTIEERYLRHLNFSAHFGIEAVAQDLKNHLSAKFKIFTGFNDFMLAHSDLMLKHWLYGGLVYKNPGKTDPVYERVYQSYLKPDLSVQS